VCVARRQIQDSRLPDRAIAKFSRICSWSDWKLILRDIIFTLKNPFRLIFLIFIIFIKNFKISSIFQYFLCHLKTCEFWDIVSMKYVLAVEYFTVESEISGDTDLLPLSVPTLCIFPRLLGERLGRSARRSARINRRRPGEVQRQRIHIHRLRSA